MNVIYLTTEQIETLFQLSQQGALVGVQIETDDAARTNALCVAVRERNGVLDNDSALIEPDGATPGWER